MAKTIIESREYRYLIAACHKVNELANDIRDKDQKKKFLMRGYPPTVEQLIEHDVSENFRKYFPYLLYYHEPDICSFVIEDDAFIRVKKHINGLFKDCLVIEEAPRTEGKFIVSSDLYDRSLEENEKMCSEYLNGLNEYEISTFYNRFPLTLERVQALDIEKNIERIFPYIMSFADPSLVRKNPLMSGDDGELIRKYTQNVMYHCLDFEEE